MRDRWEMCTEQCLGWLDKVLWWQVRVNKWKMMLYHCFKRQHYLIKPCFYHRWWVLWYATSGNGLLWRTWLKPVLHRWWKLEDAAAFRPPWLDQNITSQTHIRDLNVMLKCSLFFCVLGSRWEYLSLVGFDVKILSPWGANRNSEDPNLNQHFP